MGARKKRPDSAQAVDDRSSEDVANKLKAVVQNYDTLAANARTEALRFSWEKIAVEYAELYSQIEKRKSR